MPGVKTLRKLQLGSEVTPGTAVAATAIWRGEGVLDDQREVVFPNEDVGFVAPVMRSYIPRISAGLSMPATPLTFEQVGYMLKAGVNNSTGVADGVGSGFIYTFAFPSTAVNTPQTYTIEGGDDQAVEEMEYSFMTEIGLEGQAGGSWMMSGEWLGRQATTSAFTGAISLPAVEEVLFSKTKLYIDASGGTIGSTPVTGALLSASLRIQTGFQPVWTGDGQLYFASQKQVRPEVLLDLVFEHTSDAVVEKAAWVNETTRLIRLEAEGSALATSGTTYINHTFRIDLAGRYERFEPLEDEDGDDIYTATFRAGWVAADSLFAEILLVNELTSLP